MISNRYANTERELADDRIIVEMASEIREGLCSERVRIENFVHNHSDTPRWEFMLRCADEYRKRGGTIESHIGGPARAVLAVAQGKQL